MKITGIICEYNPLHLGHKKQLDIIRSQIGAESGIVCLMSGNFVQRGAPAIIDKSCRAKAAIASGADLVLELPITASLSSAEGFASTGVSILSPFCQNLCFGAEHPDKNHLLRTAEILLSDKFSLHLHEQLDKGLSFPAARQQALEAMGLDSTVLRSPNDILAGEYCKAILSQNSAMIPFPILRQGDYHDINPDHINPSATAIRDLMISSKPWLSYIPEEARPHLQNAALHTLSAGERAILARLRCMTETEFAALPYGTEGLWRKLMHAVHQEASLEKIIETVKTKRYTRTRIDRMILCAFLGLTAEDMQTEAPYVRVLAFNDRGREILKKAKDSGTFRNAGETTETAYQQLEDRCGNLYGLFATDEIGSPDTEKQRRISYLP